MSPSPNPSLEYLLRLQRKNEPLQRLLELYAQEAADIAETRELLRTTEEKIRKMMEPGK